MPAPDREVTYPDLPDTVRGVLTALLDAGHEAVLVGGCVRDRLIGAPHDSWDWDAATSAPPEEVEALFPRTTWENRFGTVTVRGTPPVEVTSFRTEGDYRDARRPSEVRFGAPMHDDLARRDFTINAIAWVPLDLHAGTARGTIVDPFGGVTDLESRVLRTVGDPRERFAEDALRLIRAARFAGRFEMALDPDTEAAVLELAPTVASVSAERVRDELARILGLDPAPSGAIRLLERFGLLRIVLPELAALRGIPQEKPISGDALDHTLAAVDAAPPIAPLDARLAALLHDIGKATTMAGGHFIDHETVGAKMAASALARLRLPRWRTERICAAIAHHMYHYDRSWTDAAVRRFIRRTDGVDRDLLFALRRADNAASGAAAAGEINQDALERRIADEIERQPGLLVDRRLAVDGHDLQRELGLPPGPRIGQLLAGLMEAVLEDPTRNEPAALLSLARELVAAG